MRKLIVLALPFLVLAGQAHAATDRPDFSSVTCKRMTTRNHVGADYPGYDKRVLIKQVKGDTWSLKVGKEVLPMTNYRYEPFHVGDDAPLSPQIIGYKWDVSYQGHKGIVYLEHFTQGDEVRIEIQGTEFDLDGFECSFR